jgi:hypothetical protein
MHRVRGLRMDSSAAAAERRHALECQRLQRQVLPWRRRSLGGEWRLLATQRDDTRERFL